MLKRELTPDKKHKLFIGGVPTNVSKQELLDYFEEFGPVKEIIIPQNKKKNSPKGIAFVEFFREEAWIRVLTQKTHNLRGKVMVARLPYSKKDAGFQRQKLQEKKIFAKGFPLKTYESDIRGLFQLEGEVDHIQMIYKQNENEYTFRGFAYVVMRDQSTFSEIIEKQRLFYRGLWITVEPSKSEEQVIKDRVKITQIRDQRNEDRYYNPSNSNWHNTDPHFSPKPGEVNNFRNQSRKPNRGERNKEHEYLESSYPNSRYLAPEHSLSHQLYVNNSYQQQFENHQSNVPGFFKRRTEANINLKNQSSQQYNRHQNQQIDLTNYAQRHKGGRIKGRSKVSRKENYLKEEIYTRKQPECRLQDTHHLLFKADFLRKHLNRLQSCFLKPETLKSKISAFESEKLEFEHKSDQSFRREVSEDTSEIIELHKTDIPKRHRLNTKESIKYKLGLPKSIKVQWSLEKFSHISTKDINIAYSNT